MSFTVPDACALPTVEQPLRLAEFDGLFAAVPDDGEAVTLDVEVPARYTDVLASLARSAVNVLGARAVSGAA